MSGGKELMVLPFGKHKGKALSEIATIEPEYLQWLTAQAWFEQKFGYLFQTVITNNYYTEAAETPEHNAMQIRFLDVGYKRNLARFFGARVLFHSLRQACLRKYTDAVRGARKTVERLVEEVAARKEAFENSEPCDKGTKGWGYCNVHTSSTCPNRWLELARTELQKARDNVEAMRAELKEALPLLRAARWQTHTAQFEVRGWDVGYAVRVEFQKHDSIDLFKFLVECKPTLGDDYPAVLRQMEKQWDRFANRVSDGSYYARIDYTLVCLVGEYTGRGATWEQVQQVFDSKGFKLILESDVIILCLVRQRRSCYNKTSIESGIGLLGDVFPFPTPNRGD